MSGIAWILLNIALIVGATYGTVSIATQPAPAPLKLEEDAAQKDNGARKPTPKKETPTAGRTSTTATPLSPNASLDDLWAKTLFNPDRTETIPENGESAAEAAAQAAAQAKMNIDFELVGIAQISQPGKDAVPVAILRSRVQNSRRGSRTPNRRGPTINPTLNRQNAGKADTDPKRPTKKVFKVGDPINETGYVLKSIVPSERMVEVIRAGKTVKLYIDFAGEEAQQRRTEASVAAAKRLEEAEKRLPQPNPVVTQKPTLANPGQPPAPPGGSAVSTTRGKTATTRQAVGANQGNRISTSANNRGNSDTGTDRSARLRRNIETRQRPTSRPMQFRSNRSRNN